LRPRHLNVQEADLSASDLALEADRLDHKTLARGYGLAGANAKAIETMRLFIDPDEKELKPLTRCFCAALTYASMGQKDKAFEWLEKARSNRDTSFPFLTQDPRVDPLKSDPRFAPLGSHPASPWLMQAPHRFGNVRGRPPRYRAGNEI
jgi:hypothetical protein